MSSFSKIDPLNGPWDYDPKEILTLRLLYPIIVTFKNNGQSLGNISPLFIAFTPALLVPKIRTWIFDSNRIKHLTTAAVITLLLWIMLFFTLHEIRYVLFLWAILFVPSAAIINQMLIKGDVVIRSMGISVISVLLSFIAVRSMFISLSSYSPIDHANNPQCFDWDFCSYLRPVNLEAETGDRILMLGALRYYLRQDLFACSTTYKEYAQLREAAKRNPDSFWLEVYRQGYEFIAYENDYTIRHLQLTIIPSSENTPGWIHLEPIYGNPGDILIVYALRYITPPIVPRQFCSINASGLWEVQPGNQ
jgi:hypothetical protein